MLGVSASPVVEKNPPTSHSAEFNGPGSTGAELIQCLGVQREGQHVGGVARAPDHRQRRVVMQIGTHPWQVHRHIDPVLAQMLGRADAGQHQQLRRVDGPGAQQHLPSARAVALYTIVVVNHTYCAPSLDEDPVSQRVEYGR